MSLRSSVLVFALLATACGGGSAQSDEPQTAREKLRREARAEDKDAGGDDEGGSKTFGGGWRYKGDRDRCFFIVGAKCFKTEAAACSMAKCKAPKKCRAEGAAPAQVSCR